MLNTTPRKCHQATDRNQTLWPRFPHPPAGPWHVVGTPGVFTSLVVVVKDRKGSTRKPIILYIYRCFVCHLLLNYKLEKNGFKRTLQPKESWDLQT